ncbi:MULTISPECIES: ArsR/SmtB family transcription factor [Bacillus]|uniref:Transcriptional regulator n=1 Tax=Bacillus thuringiensis serovar kumamotoensis TaxID=132267 RepID=A0A9X6JHC5_BACUK|nr:MULTISPECIES: metalloregulator ArsR/SmtB family transcription factor [Bacillus cereus group]KAB2363642.1 winged helix-turn-helix transcriptional regulator [Bacillus thuringiensis]MCH5477104.1 metalloregulator ArsR/SmtB family transcription factor [Bacillus cereus]MCU5668822.1 metalloregulator ArsR/SmtB family transcription factor [Bacillus cereus]MDA2213349.1 metalloregulator ArsR/SmtB family transcription factor [Bacillus cereus]MDA2224467.1 metalloregulator ArsR/SmtB family transcription 
MTITVLESKKTNITEEDVEILKIMAHPIRLRIINELSKHNTFNVSQLTKILEIPQSSVSQHLSKMKGKVLKAERKGLEIYYSIRNNKATQIVGILGY